MAIRVRACDIYAAVKLQISVAAVYCRRRECVDLAEGRVCASRQPQIVQHVRNRLQHRLGSFKTFPQTPRELIIWQYAAKLAKEESERLIGPSAISGTGLLVSQESMASNLAAKPEPPGKWLPVEDWLREQTRTYYELLLFQDKSLA